ncbi:lipopolysaccharide assembly protein LapB [Methylobacillus gramineus]|uniref:lipopolysaccharide assembly protein LapB n=1 Tax=Methylobacillus gramineus TaxID=755169 RepID=UPI001CFFFA62|nr:lipopolysaccharide assembly protein LapB [Methylobacillus gramineus]MCB5183892.1 lipopolysaccharide assembly protein LapB [Methylobacillus gramineus]
MEFEYWWLLALPLFFTLGWLAARVDINQLLTESTALPAAYFKGLNFLISDQHDKAIEAFIEAVQANAESMELHFALGSLFRRRGEVDRAIHLHLNLLERKELPDQQKQAVMAELAQDYLKAGLFDRAEELFTSLHDSRYKQTALRALLEIYIREREWNNAIKSAIELERLSGISFRKEVAQFHCEIAMKAILEHDTHTARHSLETAIEADKRCVRANIMLGDLEAANGTHKLAISYWKRVEFQQAEYLGLVAPKLLSSYKAQGNLDEGIALLKTYLQSYKLASILNLVYETTLTEEGPASAEKLARDELSRKPSLQTLDQFLRAQSLLEDANQQDALLMQQTVRYAIGNRSAHYCDQCGFRARNFHWQCPACNAWESLSPENKETAV